MSYSIDARRFVESVERSVREHAAGTGAYRRWTHSDEVNPYGCADAANLLYTTGSFPSSEAGRREWVAVLQRMQDAATGLFREPTHHTYHCTAHCTAALDLFDARPLHALTALRHLLEPATLRSFLDSLDWIANPWSQSHQGAGVFASLVIAREASQEFQDEYFSWLWAEADEQTGFWRKGYLPPGAAGAAPLFHHLAGSFHYLFNHEHARRPLRYPDRVVESCLAIEREGMQPGLGASFGFAEIDWVYCLSRSLAQCGRRFGESMDALRGFAKRYCAYLFGLDLGSEKADDLHCLFGAVCALAELQRAVPGLIRTDPPLRLVLDRRPFI